MKKTYAELLEEKTRIRVSDPDRFTVLTMILDTAAKTAKAANQPVTYMDLTNAARSMVASTEKAIELIKSKNGDTSKYERELAMYQDFLGPQFSEAELREFIQAYLNTIPDAAMRTKPHMKEIMVCLQGLWSGIDQLSLVDMKLANRILAQELK